ncbi:hypothetical protein BDV59DRAFT_184677 [Aspergillus ambiguus]|uniref:FAD-binding oxidoreductase n=1 Tax=Aspergillus ambiguus TaxID=176160 RepID=UPI003CCD73E1
MYHIGSAPIIMELLLYSLGILTAVLMAILVAQRCSFTLKVERPLVNEIHLSTVSNRLLAALPRSVLLPSDRTEFRKSIDAYWAQQEREIVPEAIVQPRDAEELARAIVIIKEEYDIRQTRSANKTEDDLFAIRGGGQSPISGAASTKGILIDLNSLREVTISDDKQSVVLGAGLRWIDVSRVLEGKGLAVVGGRSSDVGVAGYTLGGGVSFFTPRFGLACSNVLAYEVVIASGRIVQATETSYSDLWRALKGGSNNFGIITRFTVRCFPSTKIWSGFLYAPGSQSVKALVALHNSVNRSDPKTSSASVDPNAAGAIACFTYVQALGIQVVTVHLAHTKPAQDLREWPSFWKSSGFATLWRFWSTFKTHTITSATMEVNATSPPGQRWSFGTTTIKNDLPTMIAAREAHEGAIRSLREVKGLIWTIVMQPLLPSWAAIGDPNPLGIHDSTDDPLLIVSFSVYWRLPKDDKCVDKIIRETIEKIDTIAKARGTEHPYRYLNYCSKWQQPFEGYGEENLRFLRGVSRDYDPDGLFQRGCQGGFKLGLQE